MIFVISIYLIPLTLLVVCGIGVFFTCKLLFKKRVKTARKRKVLSWLATISLTPFVFAGLAWVIIFIWTYYPNRTFTSSDWKVNINRRYEYSQSIIKSGILIGKSKTGVKELLGSEQNTNESDNWKYDLGDKPDFLAIGGGEYTLFVHFEKGKVVSVNDGYDDEQSPF